MTQEQATVEYTTEQKEEAERFINARTIVYTKHGEAYHEVDIVIRHDDYILLMNMVRARLIIAFRIFLAQVNA